MPVFSNVDLPNHARPVALVVGRHPGGGVIYQQTQDLSPEDSMVFPIETEIEIEQRGDSHQITICGPFRDDNPAIVREFLDVLLWGHWGTRRDASLVLLASPTSAARADRTVW
jgi:hypothetical protein